MTIKKLMKIIEVVQNGNVVIADKYSEFYPNTHEITEYSDIEDIIKYDKEEYHFYIKDDTKKWCELEEIE